MSISFIYLDVKHILFEYIYFETLSKKKEFRKKHLLFDHEFFQCIGQFDVRIIRIPMSAAP